MNILINKNYNTYLENIINFKSAKNNLVIAFPTGNTPLEMYQYLTKKKINWKNVSIFMLDSYFPQDPKDPNSFYSYIKTNLLDHINFPPSNFHILNSATKDTQQECQQYEEEIRKAGGLDLAVLGIGENGHIAFNEPGTVKESLTHLSKLTTETIMANGRNTPEYGLTMGIQTILNTKKIIVLAKGAKKAKAIYNAVKGPISSDCPASFLQEHRDVIFLLDSEAAILL